jgi:hypothetical protein
MMRDGPAELDSSFAGPYRSMRVVSKPARAASKAIQEPKTPAPTTAIRLFDLTPTSKGSPALKSSL